jgi:hypothetical protein
MSTQTPFDFEITSAKPSPVGSGSNFLGIVSFAYVPSKHYPVTLKRSVEKDGNWKDFTIAEIEGAKTVRVRSAIIRTSQKGELYTHVQGLDLPWDLSKRIAETALQVMKEAE